ncbi:MAG: hypothetical protein ABFS45_02490 [Pseudomonadota bacterium]
MNEYYIEFVTNFLKRYRNRDIKTILFTGVRSGDGVSTTAMNFAQILTDYFQYNVLLVKNFRESDPIESDAVYVSKSETSRDILALTLMEKKEKLKILTKSERPYNPIKTVHSGLIDQLIIDLREEFNYIVFDGAPILKNPEYSLLCSKVDGVILVIEAGKTKRQIAKRTIEYIEGSDGEILGIVLNRRKYYIPEWIYHRL